MPTGDEIQLRGMAVDGGQQGRGIGAALLTAGVERAAARGATAVWANARDSALGFYLRHGSRCSSRATSMAKPGCPTTTSAW